MRLRSDPVSTLVHLALGAGLLGCASTPPPGWETALEKAIGDRAGDFTHGPRILSGFDAIDGASDLAVGDTLCYGIRLDVGDSSKIWYLRISVDAIEMRNRMYGRGQQPFEKRVTTAHLRREAAAARHANGTRETRRDFNYDDLFQPMPTARIRVEAFDQEGASLGSAVSEESVRRLRTGLWSACIAGHAQHDLMAGWATPEWGDKVLEVDATTHADIVAVAAGIASCDSFFAILQSNPVTKRILFDVIALPSLWSIVTNLGIKPGFGIDFFAATRVAPEHATHARGPVWSVPMSIDLNDQPALLVRILAAPSNGPAAASAGVYGLVGRHPTDPQRRVHVQLLASRRGRS